MYVACNTIVKYKLTYPPLFHAKRIILVSRSILFLLIILPVLCALLECKIPLYLAHKSLINIEMLLDDSPTKNKPRLLRKCTDLYNNPAIFPLLNKCPPFGKNAHYNWPFFSGV